MSDGALEDSSVPLPRVVDVAQLTPAWHWARLRRTLAHVGEEALSMIAFTAAMVGLVVPPVIFLFSGLWSTVTYVTGLWTLWHEVKTWRIADMFTSLVAIDTSSRFALAGVSYFALVSSFIVLFAGLLGRRWQRIFVVPGVLLCAPSVVIFTLATSLSFSELAPRFHLVGWLQYPLIGYALLDALLLAALLLDLRPSSTRRRKWLARRRREAPGGATISSASTPLAIPLPLVRFGPSQPLSEADALDTLTQPAVILATSTTTLDSEDEAQPAASSAPEVVTEVMPDALHALVAAEAVSISAETPTEAKAMVATSTSPT